LTILISIFSNRDIVRTFGAFAAMGLILLCLLALGCQSPALTAAKLYLQQNETERAKQQLEKAALEEPHNPEVHFLIGRTAAAEGDYQTMDSAFKAAAELSPRFRREIEELRRQYWGEEYNIGAGFATSGSPDFPTALRAFANAIIIDPQPLQAWRSMAYAYYRLDRLDTAVDIYERILAAAPGDTATLASLGAIYLEQQRYQEAAQTLVVLLELAPGNVRAHLDLGVAYERLERRAEAEASYRAAIRLDPRSGLAHYDLGNLYWNQMEYEAALEAYRRAVELDPENDDARFNLAVAYLHFQDLDKALLLLQELAVQMPDSADLWRELGRVYALKGRTEQSQQAYERAEALSP